MARARLCASDNQKGFGAIAYAAHHHTLCAADGDVSLLKLAGMYF